MADKRTPHQNIYLAKDMAATWGDDVLMSKTPDEVARSFGVRPAEAERIMREEKVKRGI